MAEEDWVLLRTTKRYDAVRTSYIVVTVREWEKYRKVYPENWEELTRGTEAETRRMHRLAEGG